MQWNTFQREVPEIRPNIDVFDERDGTLRPLLVSEVLKPFPSNVTEVSKRPHISNRKLIEKQVFEKSFDLIGEKSNEEKIKFLRIKTKYQNEWNKLSKGLIDRIDWHHLFPHLKPGGYNQTILFVGKQLSNETDSIKLREIYSLVEKLIKIREKENNRHRNNQDVQFKQHIYVINTWKKFRNLLE